MTDPAWLALAVLGLPFGAFLLLAVVRPLRRTGPPAGALSILAVGGSLLAALALWSVLPPGQVVERSWSWIPAEAGPLATVGTLVDQVAVTMLILVAGVSFLVQLYSLGYLEHESAPALGRYFTYHSLFAFSMIGLVLAGNFLQMFIFWELVGLCSYLLIGFWYDRPAAARAAVKAFWTTKAGDLGFIIGIVLLWGSTGTFEFTRLFGMAGEGTLPEGIGGIMLLIYLGAVGKSAQFPLHVWLPDAMEGPTPVSALIHAATMVAAGVYLVVRVEPLFAAAPGVLAVIAWVGAFTALLAATLALAQSDIKRVLAYSTVSQLGYMMAALGAGASQAGFFHLLTHGVFKALLFLGAGAVIHAVGSNDIERMGRLAGRMPQTAVVFIVGSLALAGVPPLAGFFSKEEVLAGVWDAGFVVPFLMLTLTVFLTAFYMFRVIFIAFFGSGRAEGHPHDPPAVMGVPLWVLAGLTVALGLLFAFRGGNGEHAGPGWLTPLSVGLAGAGIVFAWATYQVRAVSAEGLARATGPLGTAVRNNYWLDDIYGMVYRRVVLALSRVVGWVDRYLVDGLVNLASAWTMRAGNRLRMIQTGRVQDYLYGVAFGLLLVVVWGYWR